MEMIKKTFGRRCLLAVAIVLGMNSCQAAETETDNLTSNELSDNLVDSEENLVTDNATSDELIDDEIDSKNFDGYSIHDSNGNFNNVNPYTSEEAQVIGLNVSGAKNIVTQSGGINLSGEGAIGVKVEGIENQITIPKGTDIQSTGGKGILVAYGREHNLNVEGNINAANNAVEFNLSTNNILGGEYRGSYLRGKSGEILGLTMSEGEYNYTADELNGALVNDFNLSGKIHGGENAIYISRNSFVRNININRGAKVEGNIVSDWKHLADDVKIQYNGGIYSAQEYIPDLVTNLNFNTSMVYGGTISGADNIKINIKNGTLKFTGTADVVGVEIMNGAKLYGGTIKVNNMGQEGTGNVINHGTLAASSANTNLVINGDLVSDGILQKVSGGTAGSIIVNGNADIDGSTVTTDSLLPNETETVLVANSVSGKIKNDYKNPVPISATLNATGKIVNNTVVVTTHKANNILNMNSKDDETYGAMNNMFERLEGDSQQEEMREFYNLEPDAARRTLREIGSNDSAQILSVVQQNTAVDKMISGRITRVFAPDNFAPDGIAPDSNFVPNNHAPDYIDVNINPMNFAEGESNSPEMKIKVKVPSRQDNNFWINYMKNWGSLKGGTDYHGSAIVGGYDRPIGKKWRAGIFATYGTIGYGADSSRATVYDTRLGLYAGYHNKASDVYFYINGGQLRNSLHRGISSLGLSTNANYKSHIVEVGGEYKYDLHARDKKIWHVSPYINLQASYLRQNSYSESGAGIYNQHVESNSNTYFAVQTGVDLKRYYRSGMLGFRLGVKRGFTGADPDLKISYEGDDSNSYRIRHDRDKTHFICALRGESEFARGWFMGGEAELQLGENDKDVTASVMLRRMW